MKSTTFTASLAPDTAKIVGGFAGGPGIDPKRLADEVFKGEVPGPWLTCYMLRRFGWPNSGSDDRKQLCTWTLTTPVQGLFVAVTPYLGGSNLHFAIRYDETVYKELHRNPGREAFSARKTAAILKWWQQTGRKLYALGTGKKDGDRDELVHKYAEKDDRVCGLWRRKRAKMRMTDLPKENSMVIWWLGEFIKKTHSEVKLPTMTKREMESRTTRGQLRLHAAFQATLRDLLRPTNVRDISFSPFGDVERTPAAVERSARLAPVNYFEGAGYSAAAWFSLQKPSRTPRNDSSNPKGAMRHCPVTIEFSDSPMSRKVSRYFIS